MTHRPERSVSLPTGERVPALGLGTWRMGESRGAAKQEVAAIRLAIELGYRLFDTAEMYGEGGAETVLGQALAEALRAGTVRREDLTIVSKVYPHNASQAGVRAACDRSRQRLGLDVIDVYLLHWRGSVPLAETVAAFEAEKARGAVREWGVSNFDVDDLLELEALDAAHGADGLLRCAANQVCYSLDQRGPDFGLRPWQQARQMPLMAYCPLGQGSLAGEPALAEIAAARGATAAQIALAWTLRDGDVITIPKTVNPSRLAENFAATAIMLTETELAALDARFPPPKRKTPLAMV